jgi:FtsH-binding integral membrane protein
MFIGHFAVGLGAKKIQPQVSLGTLFLAAQFLDLLWPTFLVLGLEHVEIVPGINEVGPFSFTSYPFSHSLLMVLGWALIFGFVYWLIKKNSKAAIVLGLCVVSHWMLDLLVHIPDLPLYPGDSPKFGLGLWNSLPATLMVEIIFFVVGIILYTRTTKPKNKTGQFAFWGLIAFLFLTYLASLFGPIPPNTDAIAWSGHLQWLIVIWGYWIDRNREVVIK